MHCPKYLPEESKKANILLKGKRSDQIMFKNNLGMEYKVEEKYSLWFVSFRPVSSPAPTVR